MNQTPPVNTNNEVLPPTDRDSVYEPPREIIEGGEELQTPINRRGWEDIGRGRNDVFLLDQCIFYRVSIIFAIAYRFRMLSINLIYFHPVFVLKYFNLIF